MNKLLAVTLFAVLGTACGGKSKPAPAPEPKPVVVEEKKEEPPPGPSEEEQAKIAEQAALAEQYENGKKIYAEKGCAKCHGDHGEGNPKNPPVIGEKALPEKAPKTSKMRKKVTFKTAGDVMGFIQEKMPVKQPGSLSEEQAADVTAWILSENKAPIEHKLTADNAASVPLHAAAEGGEGAGSGEGSAAK
jgi:cytochrome c